MLAGSRSPSPHNHEDNWQPILHSSNQLVLYNPKSHALSIQPSAIHEEVARKCHYCKQLLPAGFEPDEIHNSDEDQHDPILHSRATNYFQLLQIANDTVSRPPSPPPIVNSSAPSEDRPTTDPPPSSTFPTESMAQGYFNAFFKEESRLGMGANGTVYLCRHVLDGNSLGHFAVKKIAVGESHSYLLRTLREVKLLERLRHPNIITYHHAWLETAQFSSFGPRIPTLHVLMQWAEGGSLDDFIDIRLGRSPAHVHMDPHPFPTGLQTPTNELQTDSENPQPPLVPEGPIIDHGMTNTHSRSARIRAFRAFQHATPDEKEKIRKRQEMSTNSEAGGQSWTAVHLCSVEEVKTLFCDVVEGLAFLHGKSILHLDLKPGNVLLTYDEGKITPRAMLSDFGTSRDMVSGSRVRTGNTGTLEYSSPESLPNPNTGDLGSVNSKADLWSLGMILHKLIFFYLPYRYAAEGDAHGQPVSARGEPDKLARLEREVLNYPGFKQTSVIISAFEARRLPRTYLALLEGLLNVKPSIRPSCDRICSAIKEGMLDPVRPDVPPLNEGTKSLVPVLMKRSYLDMQAAPNSGSSSTDPISQVFDAADIQEGHTGQDERKTKEENPDTSVPPRSPSPRPLLLLGSPQETQLFPQQSSWDWRWWLSRITFMDLSRLVKSLILTIKIFTIATLCNQSSFYFSYPVGIIPTVLVVLAVADMGLVDSWTVTAVLAAIHLGIIGGLGAGL